MDPKLYLGTAEEKITPAVGTALYGYEPNWFSTSVNDDLTATAYYFRQAETQALIISLTVAEMNYQLSEQILSDIEKEFHIPKQGCMIHCTHTHSAPNLHGEVGWGEIDWEYCNTVFMPALKQAIKRATEKTVPVTMAITQGESKVGINRRQLTFGNYVALGQNPWGPFDPRMTVITFKDGEDRIVANMIHYGCHGTASGKNREITRDWPGVMTDSVQELSGGITAFFNGPEGDVGPRMNNGGTVGYSRVKDALELGAVAASDAVRIYRQPKAFSIPTLSVSQKQINLPIKPRVSREYAREQYEKFKDQKINLAGATADYYRSVLESYENGYVESETRSFTQNVVRIGDMAFVSFPYELFSVIGMRIAQESPVPYTLSLSNANGALGYFATQDQLCLGGYEIEMFMTANVQPFADNADYHMMVETVKHLKEMKGF
ncbi:MAG: neutral/alkaline non-lysosomal ceramidase N-terminal domain-containing protein [Clostridia bacterium]|nr:neutral/alkaline non-lysosomal ceramidase N-terminal domain-containing protein [Clostridia bacterium]